MKKKNLIGKLWLKYTNKQGYKDYKWLLANYKNVQFQKFIDDNQEFSDFDKIKAFTDIHKKLDVKHSGNAGDIIYCLPTLKQIKELTGADINLHLNLGEPNNLGPEYKHPLGDVMLNEKMAAMLMPLINNQPYINSCNIYNNLTIDLDLDIFRHGIPLETGNIAKWYGLITGVNAFLWQKWLFVNPDLAYPNRIIIARSERYRNPLINYKFLKAYKNVGFVGVKAEYDSMRREIPDIEWIQVNDFLELSQVIAGCKLFIGNQSFPFSIAEALKIPRVLEIYVDIMNVMPEGEGGYDFFFQKHFETLVKRLSAS